MGIEIAGRVNSSRLIEPSRSKNISEQLHLEYLCSAYPLVRYKGKGRVRPDLCDESGSHVFEVKTKLYPVSSPRPRKDFSYFRLHMRQIEGYQNEVPGRLYWIFMLATIGENITAMYSFSEQDIISRDIYVAPWEVHGLMNPSPAGDINLGLPKLLKNYSFIRRDGLHIEESVTDELSWLDASTPAPSGLQP